MAQLVKYRMFQKMSGQVGPAKQKHLNRMAQLVK
jgi:hypothetical protein